MKQYITKIFIVFFAVFFILALASLFYPGLNFSISAALTFIFSLNALGALLPLYLLPRKNPLTVYLVSMAARVLIVAAVMVTFYLLYAPSGPAFFLYCMFVFTAFQIIEIQHLNNNKGFLSSAR